MKANPMQDTAIIYYRVSTSKQEKNGCSMDHQVHRCRAYCEKEQFAIGDIIPDASSATSVTTRNGMMRILDMASRGEFQHLVAWNIDRLFRDTVDGLQFFDSLKAKGIKIHSVDDGAPIPQDSPEDRFLLTMKLALAELESGKTRKRTKDIIETKRKRGEVYGHVPYGYRSKKVVRDGREVSIIDPDPYEQEVLARVKDLRYRGFSYRRICRELEREGYHYRKGHFYKTAISNWCDRMGWIVPHDLIGFHRTGLKSRESIG